jgi:PAS domain S-box-containing protein
MAVNGLLAVITGSVALAGWIINDDPLKKFFIGEHYIQPNLAIAFILAGISLIFLINRNRFFTAFIHFASIILFVAGVISLIEFFAGFGSFTGWVLGFLSELQDYRLISPFTSIAISFTGLLFFIETTRKFYNKNLVSFIVIFVFSVGFTGYSAQISGLYEFIESIGFTNVADMTWILFILFSVSILLYDLQRDNFRMEVEQALNLGLTFAAVIVIFIASNSYERLNNLRRINDLTQGTLRIKEALRAVQTDVIEIQSGVRGYVISSDQRFLEPAISAISDISPALGKLDSAYFQVHGGSDQVNELKFLIYERVEAASEIISRIADSNSVNTYRKEDLEKGKILTDQIRNIINELIENENYLVFKANNTEIDRASQARLMILVNLVIQILLLFWINRITVRNIRERRRSVEEMKKINEHLEEKIWKRTASLEASETMYRYLFENNPMPMWIYEMESLKFLEVNEAAIIHYGYSKEEFLSMTVAQIRPSEEQERFKKYIKGELSELQPSGEWIHRKKDGRFITVLVVSHLIDYKGKKARLVLSEDITERKMAEEEVRSLNESLEQKVIERTAQYEAASRAKSEFLANMSHEIRTPMNAILGYSELLSSLVKEEVQKDYLGSIKTSGRMLLTLINDILDLSKIEAGRLELEMDFTDVKPFFSEFRRIFEFKVSEKGLNFITDISDSTPPFLFFDSARVRQVILNLVGNSVKFTEKGFIRLKVSPERTRNLIKPDGSTEEAVDLVIEITDTGIGIPPEYQSQIFESFIQVRSRTNIAGTGLGLAITRRLVELMKGTISLSSVPGEGSTFRVFLPDIPYRTFYESKNEEAPIDPDNIIFEKAVIILVDDVEDNRRLIRDMLRSTPLVIIEADDGIEAFNLVCKTVPDLVITDIRMPGMNGFELLERIKTDEKLRHINVIAYSASVMKEQREKILHGDFESLLIKPVQVKDLYRTLIRFLPHHTVNEISVEQVIEVEKRAEEIKDIAGLIEALEGSFKAAIEKFENRQPISDVKNFGKELINLGIKHNSSLIASYGEELIKAAENFNIDGMLKLLKKYSEKIDKLKS